MSPRTLTERALKLGDDGRLFGILTEPTLPPPDAARRPLFVCLNAGQIHRVGPYRLHVRLARALAEAGFRSLRIDLSGKGDSPRRADVAGWRAVAGDCALAVDALETRLGPLQIVLVGLCSGADDAIRVAIAEQRVVGMVLLDPYCPPDAPVAGPGSGGAAAPGAADEADDEGEEDIDQLSLRDLPSADEMRTAFAEVMRRGGRVLSVFTDYALGYYGRQGQLGATLRVPGYASRCAELFWPDADHTFTLEGHRMRLIDQVKGWAADGESGSAQPSPTTPASPAFANPPVASAKEAPPTPAQRAGATEQHSDAMQRVMAQVWAELLEVDDIGPDDNFFDLGGHSLLAAKAVARFEKLTGVQVDKKRLAFESLAQIARSLPAAGVEPTARPGLAGRLLRVFRKG